ncbi:amidohydrolase [Halobacteriales archaeon QS_1_69_70]|nr:MAG: amidohydrolase [Halobacteriales archaeon QS_1_69_70]
MPTTDDDHLVALRRDLHRHPEPAWREFRTTARVVEELDRIGVEEVHVGPDALADARLSVPDADDLSAWRTRAREAGADADLLAAMDGGWTGCVAVLEQGEGPTVGLRVDIDGLPREESTDDDHVPAREGFRSETGAMHACGHDAHATIGVGVLEAVTRSDFSGTLKVFFQPAEEVIGGGRAVAESGHLDDVDYLYAVHVGLDYPTGEVVAGVGDFLAVTQFHATFTGEPAHAGAAPEAGHNAVQAMATAVTDLYGIPRHGDGDSRINAGRVGGGTASNIVPEEAFIQGEARGATTEIRDFVFDRARQAMEGAALAHGCEVDVDVEGEAPSADSDDELVDVVHAAASDHPAVSRPTRRGSLGGSEDATYLMQHVQARGGHATYVGVGTDHPGGHHTATFDVDEASIGIGVDVLSEAIVRTSRSPP